MRPTLFLAAAATALALAGGGAALAVSGGDDGDEQATGPTARQAAAEALRITEGGTVNAVERDTEHGATWEVEITRKDGTTVDVRLDAAFQLVTIDGDNDREDKQDGS